MADRDSVFWKPEAAPFRLRKGEHVPAPTGIDLVAAMQENVREASELLHRATRRVEELTDLREIHEDAEAPVGVRLLKASTDRAKVALSDMQRGRAEVAHWTEYLGWARGQLPAMADFRLPLEREVGEDDGDEATP